MGLTKQQLKTLSDQTFYDNNNGEIQPSAHRNFNNELIDAIPEPVEPSEDTAIATFVVDSDAKLAAWATSAEGNDYTAVFIKKGTWSYTAANAKIDLTAAGTKTVIGQAGSLLKITSTTGYCDGLCYSTKPSGADYYMQGVSVHAKNATSNNNAVGFYRCINLTNCTAVSEGSHDDGSAGFSWCEYLTNCNVPAAAEYCYYCCNYLTNCSAKKVGDMQCYSRCLYLFNCIGVGGTWTFYACRTMMFCRATGYTTAGYNGCYMSATGTTLPVADTAAGGYNRTT